MSEEDIFKKNSQFSNSKKEKSEAKELGGSEEKDSYRPVQHKKKRGFFSKFFGLIQRSILYLFCSLIAVVGLGSVAAVAVLYFLSSDLPNHNSLKQYSPLLSSRVFLQDGSKLCEYSGEKRYFIPVDLIPEKVINSFIAVEDKNFYQHKGVDFFGIARSIVNNLKQLGSGRRPQGASTITQQIARIFLIKTNEVSYIRKLKEAILAYRIEQALTKKQILELYLNQIYLGLGTYGVATAAKTYFDKTLNELTIGECAYLAGLAKGANNYHPVKHKEKALIRRNWAISRLLANGFITQEEHDAAIKEDLIMTPQNSNEYTAEYFSEELRKYLINKYPFESLNKEGIVVRATLNPKLQKCAYDALRRGLEAADRRFAWRGPIANIDISSAGIPSSQTTNKNISSDIPSPQTVNGNISSQQSEILKKLREIKNPKGGENFPKAVLLNKDGKILTDDDHLGKISPKDLKWAKKIQVGDVVLVEKSKNTYAIKQLPKVQGAIVVIDVNNGRILAMQGGYSFAQSEFNRATQAKRQIGSSFKPFVYLAGLENGFAPNSILDASPVEIDLGENLGVWKPKNYKGAILDKITLRQAIERSVNTATIRIAKEVGMNKIAKIAEQFGLFDHMPRYFSYAIGAGETTLLNLTTSYAMLANGGKKISPTMVDYIFDKNGKAIFKSDERSAQYDDGIPYEKTSQHDEDAQHDEAEEQYPPKLNDIRAQILDEQSIYQITSLLEGVMQRGSGASANFLNFPMAGKTGTSNDSRDTWFIGYTPDIAIGVFVGFDDHTRSLGKNASGSNTALPIFIDFMTHAKKYLTAKPFRIPKGIKLRKIDARTGGAPCGDVTITEAFKQDEDINEDVLENPLKNMNNGANGNHSARNEAQQVFGIY